MIRVQIMGKHDFQSSLAFAIKSTSRSFDRAMDIEMRRLAGISGAQSRVIACLAFAKAGLTQKEIADRLGIESPTLVPLVDRLQKLGLVERRSDPADRRSNLVFLTDKAGAVWATIIDSADEIRRHSQKGISAEDLEKAKDVMRKMNANILNYISRLPVEKSPKGDSPVRDSPIVQIQAGLSRRSESRKDENAKGGLNHGS
ncbi:MAG TPA: MarR family winged helix-turn-helix transcriptional regulator [Nitrososphaera sp.]|nr:MarR family winged helix-turn-helix transcriptional regulator [Nitrososphaera sp.]